MIGVFTIVETQAGETTGLVEGVVVVMRELGVDDEVSIAATRAAQEVWLCGGADVAVL